jgi:hypothetical protein
MRKCRIAAIAAAALVVCAVFSSASPAFATSSISARTLLNSLTVRAPDSAHKYNRASFGYPDDADHDGCNTRKEVLIQEHIGTLRVSSSCAVYGTWKSQYDNRTTTDPYSLEVDHMVPLAEAWHAGAWAWSPSRKVAFGNDLAWKYTLNAVTTGLNQTKQASDPAGWLPPRNRCTYLKEWLGVKYRWRLSVDSREKSAISADLTKYCTAAGSLTMVKPPQA